MIMSFFSIFDLNILFSSIRNANNSLLVASVLGIVIVFVGNLFEYNGMLIVSVIFVSNSLGTNNSMILLLLGFLFMYSLSIKFFKWECTVAGEDKFMALAISLIVGG